MEGHATLTCTSEGVYNFPAPVCLPIHCKKPSVNKNSSIVQKKKTYVFRNSIEFQCDVGHEMKGYLKPMIS